MSYTKREQSLVSGYHPVFISSLFLGLNYAIQSSFYSIIYSYVHLHLRGLHRFNLESKSGKSRAVVQMLPECPPGLHVPLQSSVLIHDYVWSDAQRAPHPEPIPIIFIRAVLQQIVCRFSELTVCFMLVAAYGAMHSQTGHSVSGKRQMIQPQSIRN